jgi:hypothetical protein
MVREKEGLFVCEACGFLYSERNLARKCEEWCKTHHSCNMEITRHSVGHGAQ